MNTEGLKKRIEAALADRPRRVVEQEGLVPAAVLLAITDRSDPHILFTKRSERVAHHKGQISFPGGIVETWDGSRLETALRECREEIGLPGDAVEILGTLDDTELVLLINDDERQPFESQAPLDERVRADDHLDLAGATGAIGIVSPFEASPDGQRFLFVPPTTPDTPFTIILNWTASRNTR